MRSAMEIIKEQMGVIDPYDAIKEKGFQSFIKNTHKFTTDTAVKVGVNAALMGTSTLFAADTGYKAILKISEVHAWASDYVLMSTILNHFYQHNKGEEEIKNDIFALLSLRVPEYYRLSRLIQTSVKNANSVDSLKAFGHGLIIGLKKVSFEEFMLTTMDDLMVIMCSGIAYMCRRASKTILVYLYHIRNNCSIDTNVYVDWLIISGYSWLFLPDKIDFDARRDMLNYQIPTEVEAVGGCTIRYLIENMKEFQDYYNSRYDNDEIVNTLIEMYYDTNGLELDKNS